MIYEVIVGTVTIDYLVVVSMLGVVGAVKVDDPGHDRNLPRHIAQLVDHDPGDVVMQLGQMEVFLAQGRHQFSDLHEGVLGGAVILGDHLLETDSIDNAVVHGPAYAWLRLHAGSSRGRW